jgi:hypothetical protein
MLRRRLRVQPVNHLKSDWTCCSNSSPETNCTLP